MNQWLLKALCLACGLVIGAALVAVFNLLVDRQDPNDRMMFHLYCQTRDLTRELANANDEIYDLKRRVKHLEGQLSMDSFGTEVSKGGDR